MNKFRNFEIQKENQRKIIAGAVYVYHRNSDGTYRTFETDNPTLGRSWLKVQRSLDRLNGGTEPPRTQLI